VTVVFQGDCREGLRLMPDGLFDVAFCDPPYGDTSLEWDRLCRGWIPEVARVLKPSASIWVFGSMRYFAHDRVFARMRACGFRYSQDIVWQKQNGTGFHNDRFRRVHEHAVLFYRGQWSQVYHAVQYTMDAAAKTVRRKTGPTHYAGHIERGHYVSHDGGPRLMRSVLEVRNEHGRAIHPTQKPLDLLGPLVRYSLPPGGMAVVPFAGSGSECIAVRDAGGSAWGWELDPSMCAAANARLAA